MFSPVFPCIILNTIQASQPIDASPCTISLTTLIDH